MSKKAIAKIVLVMIVGLLGSLACGADQPLTVDDVRLLLIGGAAPAKMAALIEQRGIGFQMTPDLEKKFRDDGASDAVIQVLRKAASNSSSSKTEGQSAAPPATAATPPARSAAAEPPSPAPSPASHQTIASKSASTDRQIAESLAALSDNPNGADYQFAPSFTLQDLFGNRLSLDDYKGKVVLLDFWATWCDFCRREIPAFVQFQRDYGDQGFQVIGLSVDNGATAPKAVKKFYTDYMMNYRVGMCDAMTRRLYGGLTGVPTTLLIGRDGRIYQKVTGAPADLTVFKEGIATLLGPGAGGKVLASGQATASPKLVASTGQPPSSAGAAASPSAAEVPAPTSSASSASPAPSTLGTEVVRASAVPPPPPAAKPDLSDPSPDQVQRIIQEFAAKEKMFKLARDNYTYHQINKVETLDTEGNPDGEYLQEWDILYDDAGKRIERVTYAPPDTLKTLSITKEDLDAFRSIQPFVMTSDELPEYEIKYLGHVKVDEITSYVFSIRPKEIEKGRQYFQGVIWVDDRDLQIVKSQGKNVPELKIKGNENLFPRFTTYREQIDGKYWFPTFTMADDTLYFSSGSVRIKEVIRYSDYKQFKSRTRIISATATDEPEKPATPPKDKIKH